MRVSMLRASLPAGMILLLAFQLLEAGRPGQALSHMEQVLKAGQFLWDPMGGSYGTPILLPPFSVRRRIE